MMWAECAELTMTEADKPFFCGHGQSEISVSPGFQGAPTGHYRQATKGELVPRTSK